MRRASFVCSATARTLSLWYEETVPQVSSLTQLRKPRSQPPSVFFFFTLAKRRDILAPQDFHFVFLALDVRRLAGRFVACRKARPRALSDTFRPILPLVEARAGNKQLKIGRPGTDRLEFGRLWNGLVRVCPVRTPRTLAPAKFWQVGIWPLKRRSRPRCPKRPRRARGPNWR